MSSSPTPATPSGPRVSGNPIVAVLIFGFFGLLMTVSLTLGVWPGEAKLTAPVLCPRDQPDAFVVARTERRGADTLTDLTMYCVGLQGEVTEVGFLRPLLVLLVAHSVLIFAVTMLLALVLMIGSRLSRRRGRPASGLPPGWQPS